MRGKKIRRNGRINEKANIRPGEEGQCQPWDLEVSSGQLTLALYYKFGDRVKEEYFVQKRPLDFF
jgi:hypothetical protein